MPSYALLSLLLCSLPLVYPLILDVEPGRQRCLQEVLSRHDLVKGGYKLLNSPTEGERSGFLVRVRYLLPPFPFWGRHAEEGVMCPSPAAPLTPSPPLAP